MALTGGAGIGGHTIQLAASRPRCSAASTLEDVANSINANTSGPVAVAIVKNAAGEDRLVRSARKTGSASDFTVTANGLLVERGRRARRAGRPRGGSPGAAGRRRGLAPPARG